MGGRSQQQSPMQVLVDIEGPGSSFQQDAIDYFCHAQLAGQVCTPCTPHHLLYASAVIFAQTPLSQSSFLHTPLLPSSLQGFRSSSHLYMTSALLGMFARMFWLPNVLLRRHVSAQEACVVVSPRE